MDSIGTATRPLSLCVVGTSNSVFADGYTSALKSRFGAIVNRSIGFSSSHVLAYRKDEIDFGAHDVCIIDCACNDGSLYLSGLTSPELIEQSLRDVLDAMAGTGCLPFVLILPVTYLYPAGGAVRAVYRQFCESNGIPFLDLYEVLPNLAGDWDEAALFRDPMHIHHGVARAVGGYVAASLEPMVAAAAAGDVVRAPGWRHRYLALGESGLDLPLARRATSLDSAAILDLAPGAPVDIPVVPGEEVVGLVCDLANSSGYLGVTGAGSFIACLKTDYHRGDRAGLVTSIVPVAKPVAAMNGRFTLSVAAAGDAQLAFVGKDYVAANPDAGVIGVILRRRAADLALRRPFGRLFNLYREAPPAALDRLKADLDAIRQAQARAA